MKATRLLHREAKQLWRLCVVNGRLDEQRARGVVQLTVGAGRPGGLTVLSHFLRLVRLDRDCHSSRVESAVPLPPELRTQIESDLASQYGGDLAIEYAHVPALIGGMRITVGSDVFDNSVRGTLSALAARFSDAGATAG
jgi:F-type H+-transporting ATPase subunit delta